MSERNQLIISHYKSGLTLQECGDLFGVSRGRVRQILCAQGIQTRGRGGRTERGTARIRSYWDDVRAGKVKRCSKTQPEQEKIYREWQRLRKRGMSSSAIAEMYGVSRNSVIGALWRRREAA